jgi:hypothetical protein
MWALLNKENIVVNYLVGISEEEANEYCIDGMYLVEMTLENSPAYVGSFYDGVRFYEPGFIPENK